MARPGLGWTRDLPDFRDYGPDHEEVAPLLTTVHAPLAARAGAAAAPPALPAKVDLRKWCPPIEDQGGIGSCTANAGVGLLEYFECRAHGAYTDASRLFLYKATRSLLGWTGDTGAYLRTTMGAMRLFGVCPEKFWPYVETDFDVEPPAFCYSFARNYQAVKYFRLDGAGVSGQPLIDRIKYFTAYGFPAMFGFTVFNSIWGATGGEIPVPSKADSVVGGHAVDIVGYDDAKQVANAPNPGGFRIRNSWGPTWGKSGYGWLPYDYVLMDLTSDYWSLISAEWVNLGTFGLPA